MTPSKSMDLNCDMGESFGQWRLGADETLMGLVTSVNIACGYHAGDPVTIERTVRLALERGVSIGAHPSYPDLAGFGRRSMAIPPDEVRSIVLYQVAAMDGIVRAHGGALRHVKLHGALYNDAAVSWELAASTVAAVQSLNADLILYVLAGSPMVRVARNAGLRVVEEAFADRRYNPDGTLQSRRAPGSLITDPGAAAGQVRELALHHTVRAHDGRPISLAAGTVCIHGDNPAAVPIALAVRETLAGEGLVLRACYVDG